MSTPGATCPLPKADYATVQLAHGGGGQLMQRLIAQVFAPAFANPHLQTKHDSAVVEVDGVRLALTTDSFVVHPLFFPGGDIGTLAVNGTVNDLSMAGARTLFITAAFVLEEGLPIADLQRIVASMRAACAQAGVHLVTGDTKVVDKGKGDGVFITTAGLGVVPPGRCVLPQRVQPGDAILINGDVGRHGTAVLSQREGLAFESNIESDCAPLNGLVEEVFAAAEVHCMRDLTRGGLATALAEIAATAGVNMLVEEGKIAVTNGVRSACELLGLDPLYVANEGRCVIFVPAGQAEAALAAMRRHPLGKDAAVIGRVVERGDGLVEAESTIGGRRVLDMLSGEQLPRIC